MAPQSRTVLHVAPALWSGAGSVITRLCETQARDAGVTLVTSSLTGDLADWRTYRTRLRRAGVAHERIDFFHRASDTFWPAVERLIALLRASEPDVVHAHAGVPACGAAAAIALSGCRPRLIGQMYSWAPDRPAWMNLQDAWGLSQCDRVVSSAHDYTEQLETLGVPRRTIHYLPWGLPLDELPWRPPGAARRRSWPVIGFVGRIEPRKGQLTLVEAFARVHRRYPNARLELVGPVADTAYARQLRARIRDHDLADAVVIHGHVRSVSAVLRRWDLFVSLSSDEGQGLALMEAMATGVLTVARPVAGIADFLVDGRTGLAVDGSSASAAAAAIIRALGLPDGGSAIIRRARRMIETRYSWDRTVRTFAGLYGW